MGGSDICPESYGEKALRPEWNGDRIRDDYEIALLRAFMAEGKPVLGVCRGAQLINVAFGGTLYQDIATQLHGALNHRNWDIYHENMHATSLAPRSGLARHHGGAKVVKTNSVHHQAVKDLGRDLVVEAWSEPDRIVEAIRWSGPSYVFAVQWHPEFHDRADESLIDDTPMLDDFLTASGCATPMKIFNPATNAVIAEVQDDGPAAVRRKYQRARTAQPAWAATPIKTRLGAIAGFRERVVAERETLARTLTQEVGKPIRQSRNELNGLLPRLDFFLAEAERTLQEEKVYADEKQKLEERITHEPLGVIANISAWNYPYFVGSNVFVPALLAGNTVLYKPSELATLSGQHIERLLHESGIPKDAFVAVVGGGATGAALLRQPVNGVFFTGSYATGAKIGAAAGRKMIKAQLELGGKDPVYVCDDVDAAAAADSIADGAFYNTGQSCCSVERIYVHEKIHDAFVAAFVAVVKSYKIGDPMEESTYIGAITRKPQLGVLSRQVADAKKKGARLLAGGKPIKRKGNWFEPTVFVDVDHRMALMNGESFGPIIGIQKVADDAEAVRLMNDTEYGLTAGVYTPDEKRARRILAQVHAGSAYWNCCDRVSPRLPWSGVGHSGVGLTLSTYGIQTFTRPKAWHLRGA